MSNIAVKRILSDLKIIKSNNLDSNHIYVSTNDEDMFNIKAMIVGPDDTPYEGGFYFINLDIPRNYPLEPPKGKFMTLNNQIRFNPNLYKNGKICVSILNTWSGPSWTTACTLSGVLLSIQSLLNERPIQNEPGWEKETGEKCKFYNDLISFFNIKVALIQMINETPPGFGEFKDIMLKHFVNNFEKYRKFVDKRMELDGEIRNLRLYNLSAKLDYSKISEEMLMLYSKYEQIYK